MTSEPLVLAPDEFDLLKKLLKAFGGALTVGGTELTDEQAAELRTRLQAVMAEHAAFPLQVISRPEPSPEEIRSFLKENVTVVAPGETLVVQVPMDTPPHLAREVAESLNWADDDGAPFLPFRTVVVHGTGMAVAERSP